MTERILTGLCVMMGVVATVAGPAIAPYDWIAVSGNYNEPGNWSSNAVPGAYARAFVQSTGSTPTVVTLPAGEF